MFGVPIAAGDKEKEKKEIYYAATQQLQQHQSLATTVMNTIYVTTVRDCDRQVTGDASSI
jgi:hypothetical protein